MVYFDRKFAFDFNETLKRFEEKIQEALKQVDEALDFLESDGHVEGGLTEGEIDELHGILSEAKKVLKDE